MAVRMREIFPLEAGFSNPTDVFSTKTLESALLIHEQSSVNKKNTRKHYAPQSSKSILSLNVPSPVIFNLTDVEVGAAKFSDEQSLMENSVEIFWTSTIQVTRRSPGGIRTNYTS